MAPGVTDPDLKNPYKGDTFRQSIANLSQKPLERLWRGDRDGKLRYEGRPDFKGDKYAERQWIKEHMAAAFRFWGKKGFGEGIAGHITVRDPVKPGYYWMGPIGKHFSSIKVSDLVLVAPDGTVSSEGAQLPIHAAGFYIHSAIHDTRPDIMAAAHCHSPNARAWSVYGKPIDIATQDTCVFWDNLSVYKNFGGVVLAAEEGKNIAEALGPKNKAILLQNHGTLTLGETIDEAIHLFYALETACQGQLLIDAASAAGLKKTLIDDEDASFSAKTLQDPDVLYIEFRPEYELLVEETNGVFLQ